GGAGLAEWGPRAARGVDRPAEGSRPAGQGARPSGRSASGVWRTSGGRVRAAAASGIPRVEAEARVGAATEGNAATDRSRTTHADASARHRATSASANAGVRTDTRPYRVRAPASSAAAIAADRGAAEAHRTSVRFAARTDRPGG